MNCEKCGTRMVRHRLKKAVNFERRQENILYTCPNCGNEVEKSHRDGA